MDVTRRVRLRLHRVSLLCLALILLRESRLSECDHNNNILSRREDEHPKASGEVRRSKVRHEVALGRGPASVRGKGNQRENQRHAWQVSEVKSHVGFTVYI